MNKIIVSGRLVVNPVLKYTKKEKAVVSLRVAVDRRFEKDATDFFNVTVWNKTAEFVANYLEKGNRIMIEGRAQIRDYETKEGTKAKAFEIIADNVEAIDFKPKDKQNDDVPF